MKEAVLKENTLTSSPRRTATMDNAEIAIGKFAQHEIMIAEVIGFVVGIECGFLLSPDADELRSMRDTLCALEREFVERRARYFRFEEGGG
jgi:hypothetical protein